MDFNFIGYMVIMGIIMFNGIIYFKYTPNGYVIDEAIETDKQRENIVTDSWSRIKTLRIEGTFNFMPKCGQFCKRPHHLIVWGK